MREIKFRGKRLDNGELVYGDLVKSNSITRIVSYFTISSMNDNGVNSCGGNFYLVIPESVGQYTGLQDKNGVEIYEGDILKITDGWNDTEYITKVRYESNVLCVDVQGFDYNINTLGYLDEECIVEVIGNIHENQELL